MKAKYAWTNGPERLPVPRGATHAHRRPAFVRTRPAAADSTPVCTAVGGQWALRQNTFPAARIAGETRGCVQRDGNRAVSALGPGGCLSGETDSRASGPGSGRPTATPRDLGAPAWAPPPRLLKRYETQCFMSALVRKTKRIFQATRIIYTHHHHIYIYFFPLLILTATNVNTSSLGMSRRRHLG